MTSAKAQLLRKSALGLNLLLLGSVGLMGWDLVRAREPELPPGLRDFDATKLAIDDAATGPQKDRSIIWRELDDPLPKPKPTQPTIQAPTKPPPACPWSLALVLFDEERAEAGAVILRDGAGKQTAVGVGRHVDPQAKAFRLAAVRVEHEADQVHAIATLIRVADEQQVELRLTRQVKTARPDE